MDLEESHSEVIKSVNDEIARIEDGYVLTFDAISGSKRFDKSLYICNNYADESIAMSGTIHPEIFDQIIDEICNDLQMLKSTNRTPNLRLVED